MAKPTLGYPSLTAACEALREQGLSVPEIAEALDRKPNDVTSLLRSARQRSTERGVTLPYQLLRAMDREAEGRGLTANDLAARLIATIVEDDLFEALLGEPSFDGAQDERGGHA